MQYSRTMSMIAGILEAACTPQVVAQETAIPSPANPSISAAMTCGELLPLIRSKDKTGGLAILWLDGYYSGRANLPVLSSGWTRTVSQGIGGTCAITVNASRPVLDVIAQLHREYGG